MNSVEILIKPNCHLCEIARQELMSLKKNYEFTLIETDISENADLLEKYKEYIPVILIDNKVVSRLSLDLEKFVELLNK